MILSGLTDFPRRYALMAALMGSAALISPASVGAAPIVTSIVAPVVPQEQALDPVAQEIERLSEKGRAGEASRADYVRLAELYVERGNGLSAEAAVERAQRLGASLNETAILFAKSKLIQSDYASALGGLRGVSIDPAKEFDAQMVRADAYFALQDLPRAGALYRGARQLRPTDFQPVLGLARLALRQNDLAGANRLVEEAAALAPDSTMVLYTQGLIVRFRGDLAAAKGYFQRALAVYADNVLARVELAAALINEAQYDAAEIELDRIFAVTSRNQRARYLSAILLAQKGQFEESYSILNDLGRFVTGYLPGEYMRGLVAYETGRDEIAFEALSKVFRAKPAHRETRLMLAAVQLRRRYPAASLALVEPLLEVERPDAEAVQIAASSAAALGDASKSRAYYDQLNGLEAAGLDGSVGQNISGQSARPRNQERLALAQFASGDAASAAQTLNAIIARDEDDLRNLGILANIQIREKDYKAAAVNAQRIIDAQPDNGLGYNIMGSVRHYERAYKAAYDLFGQALERQSSYHTARRNRALAALALGRFRDVERDMEAYLRQQPGDARAKAALGRAKLALGKNDQALDLFIEARRAINRSADLEVDMFIARARSGQTAQAIREARRALFLAVDRPDLLRRMGEELIVLGEPSLAARATGRFVAFRPTEAAAHQLHGRAQLLGGLYTGALTSFRRATGYAADQERMAIAWYQFATMVRMGRGEQAIEALAGLDPDQRPRDVSAALEAQAFVAAGLESEALAAFERLYRIEPSAELARGRSATLWRLGRGDEAVMVLERDRRQRNRIDRLNEIQLGDYLVEQGKDQGARVAYENVLSDSGVDPDVLAKLSLVYLRLGDQRSVRLAEQAYLSRPNDPEILSVHGWVLLQAAGDADKAVASLERAIRRKPGKALYRYQLGMAFLKRGDRYQARDALRAALALDDSFAEAEAARAELGRLER